VKLETTSLLTYEEQSALVFDLKKGLRDPETVDDTRTLLKTLRKRRDLLAGIADEIDELVQGLKEMSSARAAPPKLEKVAEAIYQEPQEAESREEIPRRPKAGPKWHIIISSIVLAASSMVLFVSVILPLTTNGRTSWDEAGPFVIVSLIVAIASAVWRFLGAPHGFRLTETNPMLWTIIVILVVLWLLGFLGHVGCIFIYLLLVVALILLIINLIQGRRGL